jgi:hypothetical protein
MVLMRGIIIGGGGDKTIFRQIVWSWYNSYVTEFPGYIRISNTTSDFLSIINKDIILVEFNEESISPDAPQFTFADNLFNYLHNKKNTANLSSQQTDNNRSVDINMWIDPSNKIIAKAGKTCFLEGWAVDINSDNPLDELYIKIKNEWIQCNYGFPRSEVAETFGKSNWINVGFNVSIPPELLEDVEDLIFVTDRNHQDKQIAYKIYHSY